MKMKVAKIVKMVIIGLVVAIFFGGCGGEARLKMEEIVYEFEVEQGDFAKMYLYRFRSEDFNVELVHSDVPKWIFQWYDELAAPDLVVNGFYFHEDLRPSGYFVSEGVVFGKREFDFDKSGLLSFDGEVEIIDTGEQNVDLGAFGNAAQSYPFLIKDGKAAVKEDSGLMARRSFIGVDVYNNVYVGVVPKRKISLFELGVVLEGMEIQWMDVLNLDGGPSTGLAWKVEGEMEYFNNFTPVPNVILVKEKNSTFDN